MPQAVVRRSALEPDHAALGASFRSEDVRWPVDYGDPDGEGRAVAETAGLAELGPFDELLLRGPGAAEVAVRLTGAGVSPPPQPAVLPATLDGAPGEAWFLGPDEVLLLGPLGTWLEALAARLGSADVSVIEMTGARTAMRLAGPAAPAVLAELCPVDTTPRAFAQGALMQAPLAGPRAFLTRRDHDARPGYTWLVARDEASYVWTSVLHIGAAHGLRPVGPAAVGADTGGTR
jgi:sarcosine oxidase, subunit gamma